MSGATSLSNATWPIPTPDTLFGQAAAVYEATFPGIDARSANSVASTNGRIVALTGYDLYLYQANLAQELMVDTAVQWLYRHANIWNVPQLQPTAATGNAVFTAAASAGPTNIPSGATLTSAAGWLYMTTASGTVSAGGTVSIPIVSVLGGSAYNLAAGATLNLVSPIAGLAPQSAVLDSNGAANGTDLETTSAWRGRILAQIRQPPNGGSQADYATWAADAGAALVNVVGGAIGAGSVGIYIAAAGPAVASPQLVAAVQAYIGSYGTPGGVRPVTARAVVSAATLVPVPVTLSLNPNTALTQQAATAALQLFFAQGQKIGGTLYVSRLDNAVSNSDGEYSHERTAPAADVTCLPSQLLTLGTVTFQ